MSSLGIALEYICINIPEQNGHHVESFYKTLKKEYIWPREFENLKEAQEVLDNAFENYNNERIHSSLGYLTPSEFVELWEQQQQQQQQQQHDNGYDKSQEEHIIGGEKCE